jgi:hypothetical protein
MKKLFFIFFAVMLFTSIESVQAQLSFELKSKGYQRNQYITIKGYEIESKEKYPYMFSNLSSYLIEIKNAKKSENQVAIRIYDNNDKEIASNYNSKTQTFVHTLAFKCGKTGFYYLSFEPLKSN